MGNDEDYEAGVRDGQRGGILDDFCKGLASTGSAYDKGYDYGVDHRRDSSGERYHTWDGQGTNDSKPETTIDSGKSFFDSFFGGSKSSSTEESSESTTSTSSSGSSEGGYSSGGGGGGGSYGTSIGNELSLAKVAGCLLIGAAVCFGIYQTHKHDRTNQQHIEQRTEKTLEEKIKAFSIFLQSRNQLPGDWRDYNILVPPDYNLKVSNQQHYEIAYVSSKSFYVFHSNDGGSTWNPLPATNPYLVQSNNQWIKNHQEKAKKDKSNDFLKDFEPEKRIEEPEQKYEEPAEKNKDSDSFKLPSQIEIEPKINYDSIRKLKKLAKLDEITYLGNGEVVIRLDDSDYDIPLFYKIKQENLGIFEPLYDRYDWLLSKVEYNRNRFMSLVTLEDTIRESLKNELRQCIKKVGKDVTPRNSNHQIIE